jgi:hypothetical protein
MRFYQYIALTNGNMSGNLTSSTIELSSYYANSISCLVTAASGLSGTLNLLGSVDGTNFTAVKNGGGTAITLTVSGNGPYIFDIPATGLQYVQITYTASSGSGTLNITAYQKGI